jgi:ABC-2 type transport system permease protein
MRGLSKLIWVEMKLFVREPLAAFFTLVFPLLLLVLFGSIFGNVPEPGYKGFGFVDASVPAYTALIIATSALLSLSTNLASYRELGVLRRLHVTPLHPLAILLAQVVVMFAMSTLGMTLLITLGRLLFGLRCAGNPVIIGAAFTFCSMSLFALGFVLASVVPSVRSAQAIGMAIFYPMIFLSGAAIPRELLPAGIQRAALVLPLTHVVTLLQGLWMGERWGVHLRETGVILAVMAAGIGISTKTFRWE